MLIWVSDGIFFKMMDILSLLVMFVSVFIV